MGKRLVIAVTLAAGISLAGCSGVPALKAKTEAAASTCKVPSSAYSTAEGGRAATFSYGYDDGPWISCILREIGGEEWVKTVLTPAIDRGGEGEASLDLDGTNVQVAIKGKQGGKGGYVTFSEK